MQKKQKHKTSSHSTQSRPPFPILQGLVNTCSSYSFTFHLFQSVSISLLSAETDPVELIDDLLVPDANIFGLYLDFSATKNSNIFTH